MKDLKKDDPLVWLLGDKDRIVYFVRYTRVGHVILRDSAGPYTTTLEDYRRATPDDLLQDAEELLQRYIGETE